MTTPAKWPKTPTGKLDKCFLKKAKGKLQIPNPIPLRAGWGFYLGLWPGAGESPGFLIDILPGFGPTHALAVPEVGKD